LRKKEKKILSGESNGKWSLCCQRLYDNGNFRGDHMEKQAKDAIIGGRMKNYFKYCPRLRRMAGDWP